MDNHFNVVALDFDGCIHSYSSGWTGYTPLDDPEPGALEFVRSLLVMGYEVVVMSSRAHTDLGAQEIKRWMNKHGFPELQVTNIKVLAVAYVDDRAVPYVTGSGEWLAAAERIHQLRDAAVLTDVAEGSLSSSDQ